jgi:predicted nucleic acid-binding protein
VKVIVDANIVFSGILNTHGKIGDLLINSNALIDFMAPDFLRMEIRKYYHRLKEISGLSIEEIQQAEFQICKDIKFISEEQISSSNWQAAFELVHDIDVKDIHYVAYAKQFNRKIWSGDKRLIRGLAKKGFENSLTPDELYQVRETLKKSKKRRRK